MNKVKEVLRSDEKPKEKVALLTKTIKKGQKLFVELMEVLETGTDVEKGTCADAMKHITEDKPEIAKPYIDEIIKHISSDVKRVKWGVPESIGNIARKFPKEAAKAVPKLLLNTKDKSTVIRWCAAYGLAEIAKHNSEEAKTLVPKIKKLAEAEDNNGVKNFYLKALKTLEKKE